MAAKQRPIRVTVRRAGRQPAPDARDGAVEAFLGGGAPPPEQPRRLERGPRRRFVPYILLGLGLVAAATVAGFIVFTRSGGKFNERGITVSLDVSAQATSGGELTVTISYLNGQGVPLKQADLTVEYPTGFTVASADPEATGTLKNSWSLGGVPVGRGGRVTVRGRLIGPIDSEHTFTATLAYRPTNFNAEFTTRAEGTTRITDSLLSLTVDGPEKVVADAPTALTLNLKNESTDELKALRIVLDEVAGFTLTEAKPATTDDQTWTFESLKAGVEQKIELTGTFAGKTDEARTLTWRVGVVPADGTFVPQATATLAVTVANPDLSLTVERDAQAGPTAEFGERQRYVAALTNNTDAVLDDLVVSVQFPTGLLDWSAVSATPSATTTDAASKGLVRWTKATAKTLASLEPGEKVSLTLSVPLVSALAADAQLATERTIDAVWTVKTATVKSFGKALDATTTVTTKVGTTLKLTAEARYTGDEGETLGSGPLPPTVGKTTAYRVRWILANGLNDVTDLRITATLPASTFWTGQVQTASAGTIAFDSGSRTATWTLNRLPANTGTKTAQLVVEFELSVTPKPSDVGLLMVLTDKGVATGTDAFVGGAVRAEKPSLTTDLPDDPQARGKGIVVSGG